MADSEEIRRDGEADKAPAKAGTDAKVPSKPTPRKGSGKLAKRGRARKGPVSIARGAIVAGLVVAVAVGGGVTYGVSHAMGPKALDRTTMSANDAQGVVLASYSYKGQRHDVTAKDVLDWSGYSNGDDQSYDVPPASSVLSYVQTEVLSKAAEDEGLSVSDDDIQNYLNESYGGTSLSDAAKGANLTEDQMRSYLSNYIIQQKLYDKVVGDDAKNLKSEPAGPSTPGDGNYDNKTKDYADYVVNLAKSMGEWDDSKGTFSDGSKIGDSLKDTDFSTDGASYNEAAAAYYAAYQEYQPQAQAVAGKWKDYQNNVFKDVVLTMYAVETS